MVFLSPFVSRGISAAAVSPLWLQVLWDRPRFCPGLSNAQPPLVPCPKGCSRFLLFIHLWQDQDKDETSEAE